MCVLYIYIYIYIYIIYNNSVVTDNEIWILQCFIKNTSNISYKIIDNNKHQYLFENDVTLL